jgi:hypothetical protein
MQLHSSLVLPILLATANAAPWPADAGTNVPRDVPHVNNDTSEATKVPDWALRSTGILDENLDNRPAPGTSDNNVPAWALQSVGISKRSGLVTCQPATDEGTAGLTTSNGDKEWVPVDQWLAKGTEFCNAKNGQCNQVPQSQAGIASSFGVSLTNQKTPSARGDPGHIACKCNGTDYAER